MSLPTTHQSNREELFFLTFLLTLQLIRSGHYAGHTPNIIKVICDTVLSLNRNSDFGRDDSQVPRIVAWIIHAPGFNAVFRQRFLDVLHREHNSSLSDPVLENSLPAALVLTMQEAAEQGQRGIRQIGVIFSRFVYLETVTLAEVVNLLTVNYAVQVELINLGSSAYHQSGTSHITNLALVATKMAIGNHPAYNHILN